MKKSIKTADLYDYFSKQIAACHEGVEYWKKQRGRESEETIKKMVREFQSAAHLHGDTFEALTGISIENL